MTKAGLNQFIKFCVVGAVGFAVDGGLLFLLIQSGMSAYYGRFISFPCAVMVTWWLNSLWTFADAAEAKPGSQFWKYIGVQIVGALTNLVVYLVLLTFTGVGAWQAWLAFAFGSAAGLAVNFAGSRYLVFKPVGQLPL